MSKVGPILYKVSLITLSMSHFREIEDMEKTFLSDDEMCFRSEPLDIQKSLKSGCSCGLLVNQKLVAYSLAYFTEYGTAYIDKCFVHPGHRGYGYQYLMLCFNLTRLSVNGAKEIFSMTSPKNSVSLSNFLRSGFVSKRDTIYNGEERIILKFEI